MPQILDDCVQSLLGKWRDGPESAPKKDKDGKPISTPEQRRSVAFAMCTTSLKKAGKLQHDDDEWFLSDEIEFPNPAAIGYAHTNRPHLHGLDPVTIIEKEGKKLLKIPLILLGKWRHSRGVLNFTQGFVDKMVKNFKDGVLGHKIVGDVRHRPELGATSVVQGFVQEVREDGKEQVSALAEPNDRGIEIVEKRQFLYGSLDFVPNWQSRMIKGHAMSADDILGPYEGEGCPLEIDQSKFTEFFTEEGNMPDENEVTLEDRMAQMQEQQDQMRVQLEGAQTQIQARDEQISQLRGLAAQQFVDSIVLRAEGHRDGKGRAHGKFFLDWLKSVLLCSSIGEGDDAIQLEDKENVGQVHAYYRRSIDHLAVNMDGAVPMDNPGTDRDTNRSIQQGDDGDESPLNDEQRADIDAVWRMV